MQAKNSSLGNLQRLDCFGEPALGTGRFVGVNHVFARSLVEPLRGRLKGRLAGGEIAGSDRRTNFSDESPHVGFDHTVSELVHFVLTKSFL